MPKVYIVHLRRPRSRTDPRDDPFWEFGSFGLTGCHGHNLLHNRHAGELNGARLAFAQGGHRGMRLVFVTPAIRVVQHRRVCEALWSPAAMPFCYDRAPCIVDHSGNSDFPFLLPLFETINRPSPVARFSSKFRSTVTPLPEDIGKKLLRTYGQLSIRRRRFAAQSYIDALPIALAQPDADREGTYARLLEKAGRTKKSAVAASAGRRCSSKVRRYFLHPVRKLSEGGR